jgi:hypothetical protein
MSYVQTRKGRKMPTNGEEIKKDALLVAPEKNTETQHFEYLQRMAKLFAVSGLFADIKGVSETQAIAQAFTKITLGEGMGLTPAESMTGLSIIQGRIAVNAEIRGARMQRSGLSWDILNLDDTGCWLVLKKDDKVVTTRVKDKEGREYDQPAIASFTADEAKTAGLLGKENYIKWRQDMYFARALTRLQRRYAPGVLGLSMLSREEVESDPALHVPVVVQKPTVQEKAVKALAEVREKYRKAKPEPAAEAATPERPEAEERVKKSNQRDEGTPQPSPASSKAKTQAEAKPPEKLFEDEEGF